MVAVKRVAKDKLRRHENWNEAVKKEVNMLSQDGGLGNHPNIVECEGVWDDKDYIHFVLEYCEVSLQNWIIWRNRANE